MKFFKLFKNVFEKVYAVLAPIDKQAINAGCTIGKDNYIASHFWDSAEPYLISIGNNCQITSGVKMFTHGGGGGIRYIDPYFDFFGKVEIGDFVYLGTNSLIMPGVTIGSHVIVAAGSVVTKSIPSNVVVGGNPAKIICTIDEFYAKNKKYNLSTKGLSYLEKRKILLNADESKFVKK